jgi:hypothetical protein
MLSDCAPSPWGDTTAILIAAPPAAEPGSTCEHCQQPFQPHRGKRFCSSKCRVAFHNAKRIHETPAETHRRVTETTETPETPKPVPAPKPAPEFDWHDDEESIVLADQRETAVYRAPSGHLGIRQRAWPDEDVVVVIAPQYIMEFADKLTDVAGVPTLRG